MADANSTPKPAGSEKNEPDGKSDTFTYSDLVYASAELSLSEDEDWMLSFLPSPPKHTEEAKTSKPLADDDDEINIPAIFLTQGAKNSRILKQSEEINRQMVEDENRMRTQANELAELRNKFLRELNDNGSLFAYSLKNDGDLVEKYVQKHYTKDHTLETHRHFFYFSDVADVGVAFTPNEMLPLIVSMASLFEKKNHSNLWRTLVSNGITIGELVNYVLATVKNETTLGLVADFLQFVSFEGQISDGSSQCLNKLSIQEYMKALGANTGDTHSLKLLHYNNTARVLIFRLCIVFHYHLWVGTTPDHLEEIITQFLLTISDFILNKREKSLLLDVFISPVFERIVTVSADVKKVVSQVKKLLHLVQLVIYGEAKENILKDQELIFNILSTLWLAFHNETGGPKRVVEELLLDYLSFSPETSISFTVTDLTEVISTIGQTKYTDTVQIYKNVFRVKIAVLLLTYLVYDQKAKNKDEYYHLKQQLLDCKDQLQESIGRLLFTQADGLPGKVQLCTVLSDTYHTIDQFTTVFDKNLVFLKRDFFYENSAV